MHKKERCQCSAPSRRQHPPPRGITDAGGHARVADMGLSRRLEPGAAANLTGETGTYFYMAPEVFRHEV